MFVKAHRFLFAVVLVAVAVGAAWAQKAAPPKYDKSAEVSMKGVVEELKDFECPVSGTMGGHIEFRAPDGSLYEVHLAPSAFMKDFEIVINKGDQVEVVGSKITMNGAPAILARMVNSNNYTYTFRNEQGRPLW